MFYLCPRCRKAYCLKEDVFEEQLQEPVREDKPREEDVNSDASKGASESNLVTNEESRDPFHTEDRDGPSKLDESPASKRVRLEAVPTNVLCSGCLGILTDSFILELSEAICQELHKANYERLTTYSLAISTPLSLIIRRVCVGFYLSENLKISSVQTPAESYAKEALRHALYEQLEPQLVPMSIAESPFQIILKLDHSHSASECNLVAETWPDIFSQGKGKRRRRGPRKGEEWNINAVTLSKALSSAEPGDFTRDYPLSVEGPCSYSVEFRHSSLFVGGRYCKYSRDLPQTPWIIGGVRKVEVSVQEFICNPIQQLTRSSEVKFSSSGREDCDVRMLGNGRPFLVELLNPRKTALEGAEVAELQQQINSSTDLVEVKGLRVLSKQHTATLKEGEEEKRKLYCALVWAPDGVAEEDMKRLGEMGEVVLHQKTPIRVLHRRSLATRDRTIHSMRGELVNTHHFRLHLTTQAGTYIKEFVHGDFGRTQPNLRTILGQEVDILTLDVQEVLLEWPPQ